MKKNITQDKNYREDGQAVCGANKNFLSSLSSFDSEITWATVDNFHEDGAISYSVSSNMVFESTPLGDEGLIQKGDVTYTYNYLLKDHLGSTRMMLAHQDGGIKQALMYQPYGAVSDDIINAPIPDPLRQKFTGKELDTDGEENTRSTSKRIFLRWYRIILFWG